MENLEQLEKDIESLEDYTCTSFAQTYREIDEVRKDNKRLESKLAFVTLAVVGYGMVKCVQYLKREKLKEEKLSTQEKLERFKKKRRA